MSLTHRVLGIRSDDPVLHAIAPLGLAAAAGTALIVDADGDSPPLPFRKTIGDPEALRLDDLAPPRTGVASIRAADGADVAELVHILARTWPAVVVRPNLPSPLGAPVVDVVAWYPGRLAPDTARPAAHQPLRRGTPRQAAGVVLAPLSRSSIAAMLAPLPALPPRRWTRSWKRVWETAWA